MKSSDLAGGGALVFQAGYHPRKRTFKTHPKHIFFRYKIRSQICIFACVFLNLLVMSFPKFVTMTKNTPFLPILHVFAPLNNVRTYTAWSWKDNPNFLQRWYPTSNTSAPLPGELAAPPRRALVPTDQLLKSAKWFSYSISM